jgi:hypothetical protein
MLAALAVRWREQWRARRVLTVAHEKEGLVFRRHAAGKNVVLAFVQDGAPLPEAVAKAGRDALVVLELAPEKVVQGRLSLPPQAREFLPGIVRNQIERLSPWKADQAVYGYEVADSESGLDVSVSITSRGVVDTARDELSAIGITADRIAVRPGGDGNGRLVALWSRAADSPGESLARARRAIAVGLAACVLCTVAVSGWALNASATMQGESEELASRLRAVQRQVQGVACRAKAARARLGRKGGGALGLDHARGAVAHPARDRVSDRPQHRRPAPAHHRAHERRPRADRAARGLGALDRGPLLRADDAEPRRHAFQVPHRGPHPAAARGGGPMRRIALTRPQAAAIAALVAMLLVCGAAIGISLQMRSAAADELAERRAVLARLVQASKGGGAVEPARVREAPPEAFIGAPSQGQAGAQLQSYFSRLALDQNAAVASSAVEPPMQEAPDAIRIQATLEISLNALQALLYGLETGTPYLTVDSLSIQAAGAGAQAGMADAPLRVVMMVRGQWRREGA